MPTVVSLIDRNDPAAFKKGPATDASFITEMKRRHAINLDIISNPNGRKGTGAYSERQLVKGFEDTGVRSVFRKSGASLGFFRVV
jgi:hypothetical protein